jgi:hypothetical protein
MNAPQQLITDEELLALYAGEKYAAIEITIVPHDVPRKPWFAEIEEVQPRRKPGRPRKSEVVKQSEAAST